MAHQRSTTSKLLHRSPGQRHVAGGSCFANGLAVGAAGEVQDGIRVAHLPNAFTGAARHPAKCLVLGWEPA